jgi:hypothetical protein
MKLVPALRWRRAVGERERKEGGEREKRRRGESINSQCDGFQAIEWRNICRKMSSPQIRRRSRSFLKEMKLIPAQRGLSPV